MRPPVPRLEVLDLPRRSAAEEDDAKSVGEALRAVLLFLAILGFVAWAGIVEGGSPTSPATVTPAAQEAR